MKPSQFPEAYRPARKSAYRRRIASLAEPLSDRIVKCIEMGKALREAGAEVNKLIVDLESIRESMQRFMGLEAHHDLFNNASGWDFREDMKEMFEKNGVFFDVAGGNLFTGPLLGKREMHGLEIFLTALDSEITGTVYFPKRYIPGAVFQPRIAVDTASILETAIARINLMRHEELDAPSSWLFQEEEPSKEKMMRILGMLKGGFRKKDFREAMEAVRAGRESRPLAEAFMILQAMRWMRSIVDSTWDDDEIQHTVRLCNLIIRSSLIFQLAMHQEFEGLKREANVDERDMEAVEFLHGENMPQLEFVGWMADLAYGNMDQRMMEIQQAALADVTPSHQIFKTYGLNAIIAEAGLTPTLSDGPEHFYYRMLTSSDKLEKAAPKALDRLFQGRWGKGFGDSYPELIEAFAQVASTDLMTREHLPMAAQLWKARYFDE